ncbi:unnamed protein product [Vitrella brassicaformis CCMP3155]|uniref:CCR4-NOT transcription complex subunit 1 CAF1-binding domain-containing protein n=1 Tax=Vitrella brassicaformis (strain CCMP3155) TaxID=1169540 RepID=A0A0G4EET1_VITBC|nr:unnamed protein product [Vitrella brassicaformis CCMP3155]|eukprot:CEL93908.1 unnamed protein product [Vitrella brassicaformis CCMP3155]
MVIERTRRSRDTGAFLSGVDAAQPIPFVIRSTIRLVLFAIEHLLMYATSNPAAQDGPYRKTVANLGGLLGCLLVKLDQTNNNKAAAPFFSISLPAMLELGCRTGRLTTVLPMVCATLKHVREVSFNDDDVKTILGMLREVFELPHLRLQLHFTILSTLSHLSIDVNDIERTGKLRKFMPVPPHDSRNFKVYQDGEAGRRRLQAGDMCKQVPILSTFSLVGMDANRAEPTGRPRQFTAVGHQACS